MAFNLVIRPDAQEDIDLAYQWYEKEQPGLGRKFFNEVRNSFNKIKDHPEAYALVYKGFRRALVRQFPFLVFYLIENNTITIFAVAHSSQDPQKMMIRAEKLH